MNFENILSQAVLESVEELYQQTLPLESVNIQKTNKEFKGDFTVVVFPFVKLSKKSPDITAKEIGEKLIEKILFIDNYNIIKGFLNLSLKHDVWIDFLLSASQNENFGRNPQAGSQAVIVEFSSPNTNKPLHLGHVRNNLLGESISRILEANGEKLVRVNLVNDRGIHICKSMIAWQKYGKGETPLTSGLKGDKLVGKYYVIFNDTYKRQVEELISDGKTKEEAEKQAPILLEAQEMLRLWEEGKPEIRDLWNTLNQWVYQGFEETYNKMGISFDKVYYESETYLLGKDIVHEGVIKKAFYQHTDGSIRVNLQEEGLDEKILLRADGTSVYITQDLGTAALRFNEYNPKQMIYVVGNEQIYHFDVLKRIITKKLAYDWGDSIYHLSYGMVELPSGKMKSREGTVVDADELMDEMIAMAKENTLSLGKTEFGLDELKNLAETIGLGALKYFILKVDPKKNMLFNPDESIDLNGNTAPFIQYTHARICSLLRKAELSPTPVETNIQCEELIDAEKEILRILYAYPETVHQAANELNPALIANYTYELVKTYNRFYQEYPILKEADTHKRLLRLQLSIFTATIIRKAMALLGIDVPEKM
ncbi:MAG: arginine--tRNA ligase [Bacteroidales bacterium]|jgi:arginyl-tRNA synthetase|nr:arginine--tRNA ligase [Bacteroidales bacterium]